MRRATKDPFSRSVSAILVIGLGFFCTLAPTAPRGSSGVAAAPQSPAALALNLDARISDEHVGLDAALVQAGFGATSSTAVLGSIADGWSAITRFRTTDGWYASPVHATLMADGRMLFVGVARPTDPGVLGPQRRVAWIMPIPGLGAMPTDVTISELTEPGVQDTKLADGSSTNEDLLCAGQTLTADGAVVTAGGLHAGVNAGDPNPYMQGLSLETRFDGTNWTRYPGTMQALGPTGTAGRWYPTVTRLPDKRLLVSGGWETVLPTPQPANSVETLDPTTGDRTIFGDRSATPTQILNRDYTHVFVLPSANAANDLLMIGEQGVPVLANISKPGKFTTMSSGRPGAAVSAPNWGATDVMLPIRTQNGQWGYNNGSVFEASGYMATNYEHQADVFDPITLTWKPSIDLGVMRHHPSSIVLPDGRILVLNGHDQTLDPRVQQAEYIDPANGFSVSLGTGHEGVVRGYHSVALLLPDGRVLVGGGRDQNTAQSLEKSSWQLYYPDYLGKPRPAIASAPTQINYGGLFAVASTGPKPAEAVLIGLGSMTHSFDFDQRSIQLSVGQVSTNAAGASLTIAGGPADSHVAPPGYYMLFLLDVNRVPSVAKIVHIG